MTILFHQPDSTLRFSQILLGVLLSLKSMNGIAHQSGPVPDSLRALLRTAPDSVKAKVCNRITELYYGIDPDSVFYFATQAYAFATKHRQVLQEGTALRNMGESFNEKGLYDESLKYFFKAVKVLSKGNEALALGYTLNSIGNAYSGLNDHKKASEYYARSLNESSKTNTPERLQALALIGLGNASQSLGDLPEAEKCFTRASALMHALGNTWGEAVTLANLGSLYLSMQNFEKAFKSLTTAEAISAKMKNTYGQARIAGYLAEYYRKVNQFDKAIQKLNFAYRLDLNRSAWDNCYSTCLELSDLYKTLNRHDSAYAFLQRAMTFRDSIANLERLSSVARAESRFELEKRDIEIKNKELQLKTEMSISETRSRQLITATIAGLLVSVLGLLAYRNFRKSNEARQLVLDQKQLIEDKQRLIIDSINFASRIQSTMLKSADLARVFPDYILFFQPKDIVSGDFFWIYEHGRSVYLGLFDCTGHGVPGAMMSMTINSMLNELVKDSEPPSPGNMLTQLHHRLFSNFGSIDQDDQSRPGCDACLVLINPEERTFLFSGAGCPLLFGTAGDFEWLKSNPHAVGASRPGARPGEAFVFAESKHSFEPDDLLFFSSDGIIEQLSEDNTPFGRKRFLLLMEELSRRKDIDPTERMKTVFDEWKGAKPQFDDVLVIGVHLNNSLSWA